MPPADPMWWCYLLRPTRADIIATGPTPEEAQLIGAHWAYTSELHAAGRLALAGRATGVDGDAFAIIVVNAPSEEAARQLVAAEPAVAGGVFAAELYPFELMLLGGVSDPAAEPSR
jgi:uncharacterized protein